MKLSEYRRELAAFCAARERERFRHHQQPQTASQLRLIKERFADLWTRDAVEGLARAHEETPVYLETEREAIASLTGLARLGYLDARAAEVAAEEEECRASVRLEWAGERIGARDAWRKMIEEKSGSRRHDLEARLDDALSVCADLRVARAEQDRASLAELGFASPAAFAASLSGVNFDRLAREAEMFLEKTAPGYIAALNRTFPSSLSKDATPTRADYLHHWRTSLLNRFFPAARVLEASAESLRGLGVRPGQQLNLRLERGPEAGAPACFPVAPPGEVILSAGEPEGVEAATLFFGEGGRAQHYAWSSREQADRYPEFTYRAGSATNDGHGLNFRSLLQEPEWAAEYLKIRPEQAGDLSMALSFADLHDARRACGNLLFALALDRDAALRADQIGQLYAEILTEATGLLHRPGQYLLEEGGLIEAAVAFRARAFAAGLREHLRTRYGRRWWTRRAAGDELIDLWNTASRYRVEELSVLAGCGELNYELLSTESAVRAVGG